MMDEPIVKRKPGRPRKDGLPVGSPPACEIDELKRYPNPSKHVVWGIQPECARFKRKGLAVLYNPSHPGGQVTLMPVKAADDGVEGLRWRYRYKQGPQPYSYDKIDLEPGQSATLAQRLRAVATSMVPSAELKEEILRIAESVNLGAEAELAGIIVKLADELDAGIRKWFGGAKQADQTTYDFHAKGKENALGETIRKENVF